MKKVYIIYCNDLYNNRTIRMGATEDFALAEETVNKLNLDVVNRALTNYLNYGFSSLEVYNKENIEQLRIYKG